MSAGNTTELPAQKVNAMLDSKRNDEDPLNQETRTLQSNGRGNTVDVNLTDFGKRAHSLTKGQQVTVATYDNCIVIIPEDD